MFDQPAHSVEPFTPVFTELSVSKYFVEHQLLPCVGEATAIVFEIHNLVVRLGHYCAAPCTAPNSMGFPSLPVMLLPFPSHGTSPTELVGNARASDVLRS